MTQIQLSAAAIELANIQLMNALTDKELTAEERRKEVRRAINAGANVNTTVRTGSNPHGSTPLMWAAQYGDPTLVEYLIKEGADQTLKNNRGMTARDYANQTKTRLENTTPTVETAYGLGRNLASAQSTVNTLQDSLNRQLLEVVSNTELTSEQKRERVGQLLDAGAQVNTTYSADDFNQKKSTPLMWAAQQGDVELAQLLIERGADVYHQNSESKDAAHYAAQAPEATRAAMQQLITDRQHEAHFRNAVNNGDTNSMHGYKGNIDSTNDLRGSTPLMHAAQIGHLDSLLTLLNKNADPTLQNRDGKTALMYAAQQGDKEGECLTQLLNHPRTNINQRDKAGRTALDYLNENSTLTAESKAALIQSFQERGAKTGAELDQGHVAIRTAAKNGNTEELNNLLGQKYTVNGQQVPIYDVNSTDNTGNTALHYAAAAGKNEAITTLAQAGADVNKPNANGQIPLHRAAQLGHTDAVKALLEAGSKPNTLDGSNAGLSPLMYASMSGQTAVVQALATHEGIDLNQQSNNGNTALMWAVERGHLEVAQALINAGADVNLQNKDGKTALDLAGNNEAMQAALTAEGVGGRTAAQLADDRFQAQVNEGVQKALAEREAAAREAAEKEAAAAREAAAAAAPKTQEVDIIDFTDRAHTNAQRYNSLVESVSIQGQRKVPISQANQQIAIRTLQGLEASGALKTDANGQSNAEIYLQRLILVNQMEGKNSPARKALNCLFNENGTPKTDLSADDIKTIQAGVEYSIQRARTTRSGRGTDYVAQPTQTDYTARTETREVPADPATQGTPKDPNAVAALGIIPGAQNITNSDNGRNTPMTPQPGRALV